jgi:hypothetical protein
VKTIFSTGTLNHGKYHISTYDPNLAERGKGPFSFNSFPKLENILSQAQNQYKELVHKEKKYFNLPYVVAIFPDFFSDSFDLIPRDIFGFDLISAIIQLERNYEIKKECEKLPLEKLERILRGEEKYSFPRQSLKWRVLRNSRARNKIKLALLEPCIEVL